MDINAFLNSNFFLALVTVLVGTAAYLIYRLQRRSHKKDAAKIIVLEIQGALRQLKVIKKHLEKHKTSFGPLPDVNMVPDDIKMMPNSSWNQYKYLFVSNLGRDAWDAVSTFYDSAETYDKSVDSNNEGFAQNAQQIREATARAAMEVFKEFVISNPTNKQGSKAEVAAAKVASQMTPTVLRNLNIDLFNYRPQKSIQDAVQVIELIDTSELTISLEKLKKFAKLKK